MVRRFVSMALCTFPILSWAAITSSCNHALDVWVKKNAPMDSVISALKVGADDGDAVCAAFVGVLLSDPVEARTANYNPNPIEGYRYLKHAAMNGEEIEGGIRGDVFYWLGRAYFDGKPVLQNFKTAYSWFSLGATLGQPLSSAMRDRTFFLLRQAGMAEGVQEFALRCKSSPKLCLPE